MKNGRKQRDARRYDTAGKTKCPNCNQLGQHFAPPHDDKPGFYICTKYENSR